MEAAGGFRIRYQRRLEEQRQKSIASTVPDEKCM